MLLTSLRQLSGATYFVSNAESLTPDDATAAEMFSAAFASEGISAVDAATAILAAIGSVWDSVAAVDLPSSEASSHAVCAESGGLPVEAVVGTRIQPGAVVDMCSPEDSVAAVASAFAALGEGVAAIDGWQAFAAMLADIAEVGDPSDQSVGLSHTIAHNYEDGAVAVDMSQRARFVFADAFGAAAARELVKVIGAADAKRVAAVLASASRRYRVNSSTRILRA